MSKPAYFTYQTADAEKLAAKAPRLGVYIRKLGFIRRPVIDEPFACLAHIVTAQLISAAAAASIWNRLTARFAPVSAERVAAADLQALTACGLTVKKAQTIHTIASACAAGTLSLPALAELPDEAVIDRLCRFSGIGPWSARMYLLHALGRQDIISYQDAALRKGMRRVYGKERLSVAQFQKISAAYHPYASIAAVYLWNIATLPPDWEKSAGIQYTGP